MDGQPIDPNNLMYDQTITPLQGRLLGSCGILFCLMIILSIISLIVTIKRKHKKRAILQIILLALTLIGSFFIIDFGIYSGLYMGLIILSMGNILTVINILKK